MNVYAVLILLAILAQNALALAADLLNLRALRPELPAGFEDVYDAERYRRSQEYTRARTRFSFWPQALDLVLLLGFWFAGGFGWLDEWVRGLGWSAVPSGLLFIGVLGVAKMLIDLPFRYHSTFVIEERFGFNKTTRRTFWLDVLKGLALGVVLGTPLLAAILYGASIKLFVSAALLVRLVLPFTGNGPLDQILFLLAVGVVGGVIGVVESTTARIQLPKVPRMLVSACLLSVFGLILVSR